MDKNQISDCQGLEGGVKYDRMGVAEISSILIMAGLVIKLYKFVTIHRRVPKKG